jgi:hypothetical protein
MTGRMIPITKKGPMNYMHEPVLIPLARLRADERYQPRQGLDSEHLERLRCSDTADWPPLLVTPAEDGTGYFILDGFHRFTIAQERRLPALPCIVDAQAGYPEAVAANMKHGQPLSKEDRKDYAIWLHDEHPAMSYREIGKRAGLDHKTVAAAIAPQRGETPQASGDTWASAREADAIRTLLDLIAKAHDQKAGVSLVARGIGFITQKTMPQQQAEMIQRALLHYPKDAQETMIQATLTIGQALISGAKAAGETQSRATPA